MQRNPMEVLLKRKIVLAVVTTAALAFGLAPEGQAERLSLNRQSLELPGAPAIVISTDLDGDGRRDLAVAVVYTVWDQIGIEETTEMDDIRGLVEVLTIVPALMDHRELFLFRGAEDGRFEALGEPLPLDPSVLSLEAGPPSFPLVALTDTGVSILRQQDTPPRDGPASPFRLVPWIEERPALAGTATLLKDLGLIQDLDGNASPDLLIHTLDGYALYLDPDSTNPEETPRRTTLLPFPEMDLKPRPRTVQIPLPEIRDVDGDGLRDLLVPHPQREWEDFRLFRNGGSGTFHGPLDPLKGRKAAEEARRKAREKANEEAAGQAPPTEVDVDEDSPGDDIVFFGDLDGDGRAEYVTEEELDKGGGDGMRAEMDAAKRPLIRYRLFRQQEDFSPAPEPFASFSGEGYAFGGNSEIPLPGGFQDLDGDGRQDLVTMNLDFSLMQVVKIMTVKRISIGLDFNIFCQVPEENGKGDPFEPVVGLDLSGKFNLDLNNLKLRHVSQFAGDFDGDGLADFVQMGRGRKVTLHRGRPGCRYPASPDLTLQLEKAPADLSLVQVRDFDGDDLADLLVMHPQKAKDPGTSPAVRLDLYLSGGRQP